MKIPTLQTPRLILRPLTLADAGIIERYVSDWDVARWTAAIPHPYPKDAAAEWIGGRESASEMVLAIVDRENGELIGCIGLEPGDDAGSGEFGYWIGKPFWGRGYGTEALRAYVAYAFRELGLERVTAGAMPANKGLICAGESRLRPANAIRTHRRGLAGRYMWNGASSTARVGNGCRRRMRHHCPCCWSRQWRSLMLMVGSCWRGVRRENKWPVCGNSPAEKSMAAKRRKPR
jgi:RimJ/RimL family protein N-acetyltransferase